VIFLEKTLLGPQNLLDHQKSLSSGTYRIPEVINLLERDFLNKCYICEYKNNPTINIEHFTPHKDDLELKYAWNNLFMSCAHCNNTKLAKTIFDNILNCSIHKNELDNYLKHHIDPYPGTTAMFTVLVSEEKISNTATLLDEVFNGTTHLKKLESSNIRRTLRKELITFQELLFNYYEIYTLDEEEEREICKKMIVRHLHKSSAFTAFKRWIIKSNTMLYGEFGEYC
jgi:uncharacterized protein (TIGR02646 family)